MWDRMGRSGPTAESHSEPRGLNRLPYEAGGPRAFTPSRAPCTEAVSSRLTAGAWMTIMGRHRSSARSAAEPARRPVIGIGVSLQPGCAMNTGSFAVTSLGLLLAFAGTAPAKERKTPPLDALTLRKIINDECMATEGTKDQVEKIEEFDIPAAGRQVRVRLYLPRGGGPFPILAFLHGGAFLAGNLETHDNACRYLCQSDPLRRRWSTTGSRPSTSSRPRSRTATRRPPGWRSTPGALAGTPTARRHRRQRGGHVRRCGLPDGPRPQRARIPRSGPGEPGPQSRPRQAGV